jgi:hypothetical protein
MQSVELEDISLEDFQAYEDCRVSGVTNMFDVRNVERLTGLDRPTITVIMKHYNDLVEKYPDVREES